MRYLFAEKPAGLSTHTSLNEADRKKPWTDEVDGFLEYLQDRLSVELFPVHRLDKETTGAMLFALDRDAAEEARIAFETREVKKSYLFITDRKSSRDSFVTESFIERQGNSYVSVTSKPANSKTSFSLLRTEGRFSLWNAQPESGKSHQIRLHAESEGIAILGDTVHGGSDFPALCLHSHTIELNGDEHKSEAPPWYTDLALLTRPQFCGWLAALDRRDRLLRSTHQTASSTYRWIHSEGDPLRVETLGEVTSLNWFRETEPSATEWISIRELCDRRGWNSWYLQIRGDRGRAPAGEKVFYSEPVPPERWSASENDLEFEFRRDSGLSPGLFLDQRRNRALVKQLSEGGKRVLNLFSYTSGFSLAAAKGGANQTVSVDVSKSFLDWSKRNFELNGLSTEGHEFRAMDAREYVAWALKKGLQFDIVVCDPPSFARGKKDVFRIESDFAQLFTDCVKLLAPEGTLLFSTNFEAWTHDDLGSRAQKALTALQTATGLKTKITRAPSPDWDFELPHSPRNMKCVLVSRT